jgi:hypothetical protein
VKECLPKADKIPAKKSVGCTQDEHEARMKPTPNGDVF